MGKKPLGLALEPGLIERIDAARGDVPRTRWIERALEKALEARGLSPERTSGSTDQRVALGVGSTEPTDLPAPSRVSERRVSPAKGWIKPIPKGE